MSTRRGPRPSWWRRERERVGGLFVSAMIVKWVGLREAAAVTVRSVEVQQERECAVWTVSPDVTLLLHILFTEYFDLVAKRCRKGLTNHIPGFYEDMVAVAPPFSPQRFK
jgi:hypothetical protein